MGKILSRYFNETTNQRIMYFKDLKAGYLLHVLDKESMAYTTEKVINVSVPHIDAKVTSTQMVVDITTDAHTYCVTAETEVAYPLGRVISTNRENILREVEAVKATSEQALAQITKHEETIEKTKKLLAELDPNQKAKQETEERFEKIEGSLNTIMDFLRKLE